MAITSIDIDQDELKQAKLLAGTTSNRETVDLALRTLIAVRQQSSAVERIIGRQFDPDQIDAPTITPNDEALSLAALRVHVADAGEDATAGFPVIASGLSEPHHATR